MSALTGESAAQEIRVTRLPPRGSHADRSASVPGCAAMRAAASAGRAQGARAHRPARAAPLRKGLGAQWTTGDCLVPYNIVCKCHPRGQ